MEKKLLFSKISEEEYFLRLSSSAQKSRESVSLTSGSSSESSIQVLQVRRRAGRPRKVRSISDVLHHPDWMIEDDLQVFKTNPTAQSSRESGQAEGVVIEVLSDEESAKTLLSLSSSSSDESEQSLRKGKGKRPLESLGDCNEAPSEQMQGKALAMSPPTRVETRAKGIVIRDGQDNPMPPSSTHKGKGLDPKDKGKQKMDCEDIGGSSISMVSKPLEMKRKTNWFQHQFWPQIQAAVRLKGYKLRETVTYLKTKFPAIASGPGKFDRLRESTMRGWFVDGSRTFKSKAALAISLISPTGPAVSLSRIHNVAQGNARAVWGSVPGLEDEFKALLISLREKGTLLNSVTCQILCKGMLQARAPKVLRDNGGQFECSRSWMCTYLREEMRWSFRDSTTNASALPDNWRVLGDQMVERLAVLVRVHKIPMELVINMDQTGMALVPVSGERTYALRGAKEVAISGRDDKRAITVVPSLSATGELLPFQVIFTGKTKNSIPMNTDSIVARQDGWHLTSSDNHWSNLKCVKAWFDNIVRPYYSSKCCQLGFIPGRQRMVVILDCWTVHRSAEFHDWLKVNHPYINLIYVPARCTSKLQPCDIILQRPLKAGFQREWHMRAVQDAAVKFNSGIQPGQAPSPIEFPIALLRNQAIEHLLITHKRLREQSAMLMKGFEKAGLLRAWDAGFDANPETLESVAATAMESEPDNSGAHWGQPWDAEIDPDLVMEVCAGTSAALVEVSAAVGPSNGAGPSSTAAGSSAIVATPSAAVAAPSAAVGGTFIATALQSIGLSEREEVSNWADKLTTEQKLAIDPSFFDSEMPANPKLKPTGGLREFLRSARQKRKDREE